MRYFKFEVPVDPIPAQRPRFSGKHAYQPKRNVEYRQAVRSAASEAMSGREILRGAVAVSVRLFRRFKSTARNYGDVDNLAKAIFDGMNQIVFVDDSQICRCLVEKFTDKKNPRAVIEVEAVDLEEKETAFEGYERSASI